MTTRHRPEKPSFIARQLKENPWLRDSDAAKIEVAAQTAVAFGRTVESALALANNCERIRREFASGAWLAAEGCSPSFAEHRALWLAYLTALRTAELA